MIKFKIRNEEQEPTEKNHEIEVWLHKTFDGAIVLSGKNANRSSWTILRITTDGFLKRDDACAIDGLQKDENDTIKEQE